MLALPSPLYHPASFWFTKDIYPSRFCSIIVVSFIKLLHILPSTNYFYGSHYNDMVVVPIYIASNSLFFLQHPLSCYNIFYWSIIKRAVPTPIVLSHPSQSARLPCLITFPISHMYPIFPPTSF